MKNTNWLNLITQALHSENESWEEVVSKTISDEELNVMFDNGFGCTEGITFTVWTKNRVYFPSEYDGAEGVASVSRNPDGKPTPHI